MPLEEDKKLTRQELKQILDKYGDAYHSCEEMENMHCFKLSREYEAKQEEILGKLWERICTTR